MPFRAIVGHRRLVELLARSVRHESLPPSLIFAGPAGVGKRLAAMATAQALNCTAPILGGRDGSESVPRESAMYEIDACGVCATCTRIARGVHPDVLIVEPGDSGSIKIEQVRDIVDRAAYRPFEGRRRAVIIDDAEALVPAAQNALLKTLEEPPPSSVFMLITARPDMLLATVRSRCPRLRFGRLGPGDIATALIANGHSDTKARAVAATADGSLQRALASSAEDAEDAREIAHRVLEQAASSDDLCQRIELGKALLPKTGAGSAGDREQLASHLRAMASLLRDIELLSTRADVRALANPDVQPALERLTTAYEGGRGMRAFTAVDQAIGALDRNAGVKIVADWLVLQL